MRHYKTQLIFCSFCFLKPKDTIADQSISTFLKCQLCIYATHKSTNKQTIQNYGGSADLILQPCILCCLWDASPSNWAIYRTDLAPTIVLKYISLSWRDGTVGFGGSTFKEAIEKCLSMDQHSGTIVFQQFSTRKSLRPMINSENFSFSQKLSKKKILFLVMAGVLWVGDMCEICINSVAQFRTWRWKSSAN